METAEVTLELIWIYFAIFNLQRVASYGFALTNTQTQITYIL